MQCTNEREVGDVTVLEVGLQGLGDIGTGRWVEDHLIQIRHAIAVAIMTDVPQQSQVQRIAPQRGIPIRKARLKRCRLHH